MTGRWVTHAIIYLSACSTLSLVWVVLGHGSLDELRGFVETPGDALTRDFWPVWAWLVWGTVVVAHGATVLGRLIRVGQRRLLGDRPQPVANGRGGPRRRYVAAMFTDISGSTGLAEAMGDRAWADVVATHREIVRAATAEFSGTEVATQGDGFFVRFGHPTEAAECAMTIERRLEEERTEGRHLPPVRVGIHVGDAIQASDDDVLGQVVNVAARLLDVAGPDEILVTEPVADHVDPDRLVDRGLVELKGVGRPRHVLSVEWRQVSGRRP